MHQIDGEEEKQTNESGILHKTKVLSEKSSTIVSPRMPLEKFLQNLGIFYQSVKPDNSFLEVKGKPYSLSDRSQGHLLPKE